MKKCEENIKKLLSEKRELLIEKINEEFKEFIGDLGYYDGNCQYNIIKSFEYISAMIYAYSYINTAILDHNLIDDDQVDYLLKLEKPLDKISDLYAAMLDSLVIERIELFNKAIRNVVKEGE